MTRFAFAALLAAGVFAAASCDDVTPLPFAAEVRDAAVPDHVDLGEVAACRTCATDPGAPCRPALDRCQAMDSRCGALLECLTDANCWRQLDLLNFANPPPCASDCLATAGVTSINEIGVPATEFYVCIVDPNQCAPACFGGASDPKRDE